MKSGQSAIIAVIVSLALCSVPLAFAADNKENKEGGWYVGGGMGGADDKGFDDTETALKIFGGYRVSRYFAAEGALVSLGEFGSGTLGIGSGGEFFKGGFSLQGVGTLPIGQRGQFFGKLGVFFWSILVDTTCVVVNTQITCVEDGTLDDGVDPVYGIGFQYRFNHRWHGRVEFERYQNVGDDDVVLGSISAVFAF